MVAHCVTSHVVLAPFRSAWAIVRADEHARIQTTGVEARPALDPVKLIIRRRVRSALRGFTIPEVYESAAFDDRRERECLVARAASDTPLRLHIGCGPRVLAGWVNIDLAYQPFANYMESYGEARDGPALRGTREDFFAIDVTRGLPLPDGYAEVVNA